MSVRNESQVGSLTPLGGEGSSVKRELVSLSPPQVPLPLLSLTHPAMLGKWYHTSEPKPFHHEDHF